MDDPVKQIEGVIRSLTQGSPNEQSAALKRFYVPNAEFIHPFCRVPPFSSVYLPLIGEVQSRQLVLAIYRWYRMLSPRIDLEVKSVQFDEARQKLYVDINQRFSMWFIPFMVANVNLVCRLSLVKAQGEAPSQRDSYRQIANGEKPIQGHNLLEPIQNGELPSFAEVAQSKQPLSDSHASDGEVRYYVAKQEDLYQVNELIKFIVPFGIGDAIISAWQLFATYLSLLGSIVFFPFVWILTHGGESGNVMPPVERVEDDGRVVWRGSGADWARRRFSPLNSIGASAVQGIVVNVQENAQTLAQKGERFASNVQQRGEEFASNVQQRGEKIASNVQQTGEKIAANVQQRSQKLIHEVVVREEQMVKAAEDRAGRLANGVQQGAEGVAQVAQAVQDTGAVYLDAAHRKTADFIDSAQKKEERLVKGAQAKEEQVVGELQKKEERGAENTKQWLATNKTKKG